MKFTKISISEVKDKPTGTRGFTKKYSDLYNLIEEFAKATTWNSTPIERGGKFHKVATFEADKVLKNQLGSLKWHTRPNKTGFAVHCYFERDGDNITVWMQQMSGTLSETPQDSQPSETDGEPL